METAKTVFDSDTLGQETPYVLCLIFFPMAYSINGEKKDTAIYPATEYQNVIKFWHFTIY